MKLWQASSGASLAALAMAACTAGGHPLPGLDQQAGLGRFSGAQQQIVRYYDAHASEEDRACDPVKMDVITRSRVASQTDDRLTLDIEYGYSSAAPAAKLPGGRRCDGFASRTFDFERSGDSYKLLRMSGDSR